VLPEIDFLLKICWLIQHSRLCGDKWLVIIMLQTLALTQDISTLFRYNTNQGLLQHMVHWSLGHVPCLVVLISVDELIFQHLHAKAY